MQNDLSDDFVAVLTTFHKTEFFGYTPDCVIYEKPDGTFVTQIMLGDRNESDGLIHHTTVVHADNIESLVILSSSIFEANLADRILKTGNAFYTIG